MIDVQERPDALLAYGTLMIPAVMERVAGPPPLPGEEIVLHGWRRHAVRGATYPALVPSAGAQVQGRLYRQPSAGQLRRLDDFEGPEYERVAVPLAGGSAWVYRWIDDPGRLLRLDWDEAAFRREGLPGFLQGFTGWDRLDGRDGPEPAASARP